MTTDQLIEWLDNNAYALAMAAVIAYETAPNGSGIDGALGMAGTALMAMVHGETCPLEAASSATGVRTFDRHYWAVRRQLGDDPVLAKKLPE